VKINFIYILVFSFIAVYNLSAQKDNNSVSGIVIDNATNEPLPNVNIYISNTTWGTTTKLDGTFILKDIIIGNHELVFSMIGYDTKAQLIKIDEGSDIHLNIRLIPKIYKFSDVTITAERPEEWFDDLEVFKGKFLGYSPYTINSQIINPYLINFTHPFKTTLIAECEYPVEIINYDLGYQIKCEIIEFKFDESQQRLDYTYRLFYTEIDTDDTEIKEEWANAREKKYKESLTYFFRSIKDENYRKAGFELTLVYKPGREGLDILDSKELLKKNEDNTFKIEFEGYLRVINFNIADHSMRTSWVKLNYPSVTFDEYGYPLEKNAITLLGAWSELGIASFLPKYYGFEESTLRVNQLIH